MDRFRRMMDSMQFETLPLFSKPHFSWNLRTDYVGRRFVYRPESESTMDDARRMLERFRLTSGAVLLAETQTGGRGRGGRSWVSPPDVNLYFTVIMSSSLAESRHFAYVTPLATALAIEEVAARLGADLHADLKWPNDVQLGGHKVAGILIETTERESGEPVTLVGVGINVNVDVAAYPEIAGIATSLRDVIGAKAPREEVLGAFCNHFEALYEEALAGSRAPFDAWRQRLITLGRQVVASGGDESIAGVAVDVDDNGALIIETPEGRRVRVEAGDVTLSADGGFGA
ncbi:MAG: biotin--[acetyl-CoA-carboxylase] ligase [Dehalococcoidia bacterium]|nr:biotin--[acetyl-CoA-carboxylase] ligase [Dehalococcoidia bacterium]